MKFTQIPENTFKEMQLNAGILLTTFDPTTATIQNSDILAATSGGVKFDAKPTYKDLGDVVDNCPKNTKELKKLDFWDVKMSGNMITITPATAKKNMAAADVDSSTNKITPRNDLESTDFEDLWWVGDYSDKNGDADGGFCAIHMMNTLSTGGFSIQTADRDKGQFAFEYTAHYSTSAQDTVPFEVYIKAGA